MPHLVVRHHSPLDWPDRRADIAAIPAAYHVNVGNRCVTAYSETSFHRRLTASSSRFIWPASGGTASTLDRLLTVTPSNRTDARTGNPAGMAFANSPGRNAEMASVRQIPCASVCARVTVSKFGKRALMLTVRPASPSAWRRADTCPAICCRVASITFGSSRFSGKVRSVPTDFRWRLV